jgi:3-keto-5-aminohexanoate cleavage enzyme
VNLDAADRACAAVHGPQYAGELHLERERGESREASILALAVTLGGHVRVGLEDNPYMAPGGRTTQQRLGTRNGDARRGAADPVFAVRSERPDARSRLRDKRGARSSRSRDLMSVVLTNY